VSKCNVGLSHMFIYIYIWSYYKLFSLCLSVMLDCLTCSFTSISYLTTSSLICVNVGLSFIFIYIYYLSYYKLFNLYLSLILDCLSCSFLHPYLLQNVHFYNNSIKVILYSNKILELCMRNWFFSATIHIYIWLHPRYS